MDIGLISTALIVAPDELGERVRRVLDVIDRIHGVGPLPRIPLDHRVEVPGADRQYRFKRRSGEASGIGISQTAPHLELVLLHDLAVAGLERYRAR